MRAAIIAVALCLGATSVAADPNASTPWYRGEAGRKRILHLAIAGGFGLTYIASETVFKSKLAATECRWCEPPTIDRGTRDLLVWDDTARANLLSNLDGYVAAPVLGFALLIASDYDAGWGRLIDDTVPVIETVAITQTLTQIV